MIVFTKVLSKGTQLLIKNFLVSLSHYKVLRLLQFVNLYRSIYSNWRNANKESNVGSTTGGMEDEAYETWSKIENHSIVSTKTY